MALTGPLTSALTGPLTTSLTGVSGPAPILLMPLVNNLNLSIGIGSATFTRSSTGTFIDSGTGLVTTASTNAARFEANGVLIEGASTNLQRHSEEFSNAVWALDDSVINDNVTVAPDGNTTADRLIDNNIGGTSDVRVFDVHALANSNDHTFSVFLKTDQLQWAFMQTALFDTSGNGRSWFDLSLCALGTISANHTATIKDFGNGWCRCSITMSSTTDLTGNFYVGLADADGDFVVDKDGTSSIFVWGAQLEELPFVSSYIPTAGTTVTRSSDNLSIDSDNIPAPTADYSVALTSDFIGLDSSVSQVLFNVVGETSRRIEWNTTTGAIEAIHGAVTSTSTSTFNPGDRVDIAFVVDGTNQTLYIDGVEEDQDAKGTATGTKTAINIGRQASTNQASSHIKPLQIFDIALTPSEVADL